MPLNFPNSPTANQIFTDSTTGSRYLWDATNNVWRWSLNNVSVVIQSLAPGSPSPGQLWWNTDVGRLYIYYTDADSSQWVEASPSSASIDVATLTSYVNVASDLAKIAFQTANIVFPAYTTANAGFSVANAAYTSTNASYVVANAAFNTANIVIPAYATANAGFNVANAAYTSTNAAFSIANSSFNTTNVVYLLTNAAYTAANAAVSSAAAAVSATIGGITTTGNIATTQGVSDRYGDLRNLPVGPNRSTNYSLILTDNGQIVSISAVNGNVFVTSGIFSSGNTITVYNNTSSNVTITQNAGVVLNWAGLPNTGNRILQQKGLATLVCIGTDTFVITGAGFAV